MGKSKAPSKQSPGTKNNQGNNGNTIAAFQAEFSGPLPHPSLLEHYDNICPGFAERIVSSWEKETAHRHELEKQVVTAEIEAQRSIPKEIRRGQYLAFLLSVLFLVVGGGLVYFGKEVSGSVLGGAGFIGTITSFLTTAFQSRQKQQPKE